MARITGQLIHKRRQVAGNGGIISLGDEHVVVSSHGDGAIPDGYTRGPGPVGPQAGEIPKADSLVLEVVIHIHQGVLQMRFQGNARMPHGGQHR